MHLKRAGLTTGLVLLALLAQHTSAFTQTNGSVKFGGGALGYAAVSESAGGVRLRLHVSDLSGGEESTQGVSLNLRTNQANSLSAASTAVLIELASGWNLISIPAQ